jgi:hypothetical protein
MPTGTGLAEDALFGLIESLQLQLDSHELAAGCGVEDHHLAAAGAGDQRAGSVRRELDADRKGCARECGLDLELRWIQDRDRIRLAIGDPHLCPRGADGDAFGAGSGFDLAEDLALF